MKDLDVVNYQISHHSDVNNSGHFGEMEEEQSNNESIKKNINQTIIDIKHNSLIK